MTTIPQSSTELQNHFDEQLEFLAASSDSYDRGFEGEAKRLATTLRILLHDTSQSKSLLDQLGLKRRNFWDSAAFSENTFSGGSRFGSFTPLAGLEAGKDGRYVPYLDEYPPGMASFVPFNAFWDRIILIDNSGIQFSRKDMILAVANKDGGAHIDPNLDENYHRLTRENSMGWEITVDGKNFPPAGKVELAVVRQIAHEVLRTFKPSYPKKKFAIRGMPVISTDIVITKNGIIPPQVINKIGRNDSCPCGSGLKFKKCHGK